MKEDKYIFGSPGYWYVIVGEIRAGYFSTLSRARKYVKRVTD